MSKLSHWSTNRARSSTQRRKAIASGLILVIGWGFLTPWNTCSTSANFSSKPQSVTAPDLRDTDSVRLIAVLESPPLAVRQEEIQENQELTLTQREASINAYGAKLVAEQTAVVNALQEKELVQQVGRQFTYLVNGIALRARWDDREAIVELPQVRAVYFDHQVHTTLADSVPLIGATVVWAMTDESGHPVTGQDITVAVIDTGIDYTHPDLGGCFGVGCRVTGGYDFVNDDGDPMDDHSHGTHVAGIVAGNGTITGVAPEAALMAYKACNASGACWTSDVIAALEQAVMEQVDVINLSLGGPGSPDDPMAQAVNQVVDQGVVVVVAAGNDIDYHTINSPGVAAKAFTVGATTKGDTLVGYTSKGPVDGYLIKPDLVAPGYGIRSSTPGHGYAEMSGTSMASPHVAGAVALLKQLHPDWTPAMLKANLMNTALFLGTDPFAQGSGRVQVDQAAAATVLAQPGSLSLGRIDASQPVWTTVASVEIRNLTTTVQSYQLSVAAGFLPTGVTTQLSHTSVALDPGQTQVVSLTVTVDTDLAPYPTTQPYSYYGRIIITNGTEQSHVPFAFMPPPIACDATGQIPASECVALEALYHSTNGPGWYWRGGWLNTPPCGWYGVTCRDGHVAEIRLIENNLSGSIPPELGNLTHLCTLTLIINQLSGDIPPELGNMSNIQYLWLFRNQLSGDIPAELGNLINLQGLLLTNNQLSGSIPPELGDLVSLESLWLGRNQLSGSIPTELRNLVNLSSLLLNHNHLSGSIPPELGDLSSLQSLWLLNNQLSGSIPPELGDLHNLILLLLYDNQLSGNIPPELGNLANLESLQLADNQLSGSIPSELGNMVALEALDLGKNRLSGDIPPALGDLSNLRALYVDNNALEGQVPGTISNLTLLSFADIGYNKLAASDPAVVVFLNDNDPDWAQTQTVPPANMQAVAQSSNSVRLTWTPIFYTTDGGHYEISYARAPGGPYTVHGTTNDKTAANYLVDNLPSDATYHFVVRTLTPAHGEQQNDLSSQISEEVSATLASISVPSVQFSQMTFDVCESKARVPITITLDVSSAQTITVMYSASDGTASAGSDYTVAEGILNFYPGDVVKTFFVEIVDDTLKEGNETVVLALANANNAIIGETNPATLTILDDDFHAPDNYFIYLPVVMRVYP